MNHRSQITDTQYTIHRYADTQKHRCTNAQMHRYTAHSTQIAYHKKSQNHNTDAQMNFNASMNNEE
jgi:hypothetical protein